ncbi:MAG: 3'-5' exonuclease [Steroidobacteraceae bacterium]
MPSSSVVVLDCETTGLSPRSDRITEVAALRIVGARVVERYILLVNAGVRIPAHITSLTGITDEMIATAPRANDVIHALVDFIASDLVVAHNASFDYGFLSAECFTARILNRSFQLLCTMRLARRLLPGCSS